MEFGRRPGSGLRERDPLCGLDGRRFRDLARRSPGTDAVFTGEAGRSYAFLALARDAAGNRERPAPGVVAPDDGTPVDLGGTLVQGTTGETPLPPATPPAELPANALFLQALSGIPAEAAPTRPPAFADALAPFTLQGLVSGLDTGQGGVGVLALVGLPDGSLLFSGGQSRGALFRIAPDGAFDPQPFALLADPVFDMALAPDGRLWATTGGGALLELDPGSGQVLGRFGDGITQSVAIDAGGRIFVTTGDGIARFDPETGQFAAVTALRADDLAVGPDGQLWATSWPDRGRLLRIAEDGAVSLMATLPGPADSLAFGPEGSEFEGLALLTSAPVDGVSRLYAVDLASLDVLAVAEGPVRGEGIAGLADGRVVIAHSTGIDVLRPLRAPAIVASSIEDGAVVARPVAQFSVQFDDDMATEGPGSVLDPGNVALFDETGAAVPFTALTWDPEERVLTASFAALPLGTYDFAVAGDVRNARGVALGQTARFGFLRIGNVTDQVEITYLDTRLDRTTGAVSYDVVVTNTGGGDLVAPLTLTMDLADPNADGIPLGGTEQAGIFLIDLSAALGEDGVLSPGESTTATAVTILISTERRAAFEHGIRVIPTLNTAPVLITPPPQTAEIGLPFGFDLEGSDPDGTVLGYVLLDGPEGLSLDPATGRLSWTPGQDAAARNEVRARVYDGRGAYAEVGFVIEVTGGNRAPILARPNAEIVLAEGETMRLPILAQDPDGDALILFADNLPPGAYLDRAEQELVWTPQAGQAGTYRNVVIGVSDGTTTTDQGFAIRVTPTDFPPVVPTPPARTVREGDPLTIVLGATDPEGGPLAYSSSLLPAGATLDPETGVFRWTPGFTQAGEWVVPVTVSDGTRSTTVDLALTVLNANGAPELRGLES